MQRTSHTLQVAPLLNFMIDRWLSSSGPHSGILLPLVGVEHDLLDIASHVSGQVDNMRPPGHPGVPALVVSAPGRGLVELPHVLLVVAVHVKQRAQPAFLQHLLDRDELGHESVHLPDGKLGLPSPHQGDQSAHLFQAGAEGLFAENVFAGLHSLAGKLEMQRVGDADGHCLQPVILEELIVVGVGVLDAELSGNPLELVLVPGAQRVDPGGRDLRIRLGVQLISSQPQPDDPHVDSVHDASSAGRSVAGIGAKAPRGWAGGSCG